MSAVSTEASRRGGQVTARQSAAKARAVAVAHAAKRRRHEARLSGLSVPAGFIGLDDFFATLREFLPAEWGRTREVANAVGVSDSTLAKYLTRKITPSAEKLALIAEWYLAKLAAPGVIRPPILTRPAAAPAATRNGNAPREHGLGKLSPALSERLRRTARLRNVTPALLAEQILGRHLPSLEELER